MCVDLKLIYLNLFIVIFSNVSKAWLFFQSQLKLWSKSFVAKGRSKKKMQLSFGFFPKVLGQFLCTNNFGILG